MKRLLQLLKRSNRIPLAQTQEAFEAQATQFLIGQGFPDTIEYRKMFGAFIQHSKETEDTFDPDLLARCIRKAKAAEFAFYLMHPERKEKPNEQAKLTTTDLKVV